MTRARDIANLVDSNGDIVAGALDNVPASDDASALTTGTLAAARLPTTGVDASSLSTGTLAAARLPSSGVDAASLTTGNLDVARISANSIDAGKLATGKYVKQMVHFRRDSSVTASSDNYVAMSGYFNSPVTIGNQILIMCSGLIVSGTAYSNWGSGGDVFLDNTRLTSNLWLNGSSYYAHGAMDVNAATAGGGSPFGISAIGTAASTNPMISFRTHRNTGWTWTGLNYSFTSYGHTSSNITAIEFGT